MKLYLLISLLIVISQGADLPKNYQSSSASKVLYIKGTTVGALKETVRFFNSLMFFRVCSSISS